MFQPAKKQIKCLMYVAEAVFLKKLLMDYTYLNIKAPWIGSYPLI